jgi:hypothetical protein
MKLFGFPAVSAMRAAMTASALALSGCTLGGAMLAAPALAEPLRLTNAPTPSAALDSLREVPVFFVADANGRPAGDDGANGPNFYLNRTQASLALGYARGQRPAALTPADDLHIEVTDLARATASGPGHYIKPPTAVEAAAGMDEAPLFLVRDPEGAPYTLRGPDGRRRVYFFLSENDALDFIGMVMDELHVNETAIRLSLVPLPVVVRSMQNAAGETVNWAIWSNAEVREDAAVLKASLSTQSAQLPTGTP